MNGTSIKKFLKKLWSVGMFLQKAMKQGRNVHSIFFLLVIHYSILN